MFQKQPTGQAGGQANGQVKAPQPPTFPTVREFFGKGLAIPFVMSSDGSITVPTDHPLYEVVVNQALINWIMRTRMGVDVKQNSFGRFEATIVKDTGLGTDGRLALRRYCTFTANGQGEAAYRAVMLYEEKKAAGEYDNEPTVKGLTINESGNTIRDSNGNLPAEAKVPGNLDIIT